MLKIRIVNYPSRFGDQDSMSHILPSGVTAAALEAVDCFRLADAACLAAQSTVLADDEAVDPEGGKVAK